MASEMAHRMRAIKCPTDELSLTNKAIVNVADFTDEVKSVFSFFFCFVFCCCCERYVGVSLRCSH